MKKRQLYLLGSVTLLIFPIPTFVGLWWMKDISPMEILQFDRFQTFEVGMGAMLGYIYSFVARISMKSPVFDKMPMRIEEVLRRMRLTVWDSLFLAICAGVGEELLFRSGMQLFIGPFLTSIIFVAIHGYLNPFNWRISLYGLIILPLIFMISWGFESFGLWFAIAAHTVYDFVLFLSIREENATNDANRMEKL